MNKLEVKDSGESSLDLEHQPSFTLKGENARVDKGEGVENASQHGLSTLMVSLSIQQLQDMITNIIQVQYGGSSTTSLIYSKPYTKRINNMRMSNGYQPPKFLQFDGKGNPNDVNAYFKNKTKQTKSPHSSIGSLYGLNLHGKGNKTILFSNFETK